MIATQIQMQLLSRENAWNQASIATFNANTADRYQYLKVAVGAS